MKRRLLASMGFMLFSVGAAVYVFSQGAEQPSTLTLETPVQLLSPDNTNTPLVSGIYTVELKAGAVLHVAPPKAMKE